jgi:hypothetical protein
MIILKKIIKMIMHVIFVIKFIKILEVYGFIIINIIKIQIIKQLILIMMNYLKK